MPINSITVDPNNNGTNKPNLTLALSVGLGVGIYEPREDLVPGYDFVNPDAEDPTLAAEIEWDYESGYPDNQIGEIYTFHAVGFRGILKRVNAGEMNVGVTIIPLDTTTPAAVDYSQPVASSPARMYNVLTGDKVTETARVRFSGKNSVFINKAIIFVSKKNETKPRE